MAKMFYNLAEAASILGVDEDAVRKLVQDGKLQQFRDREKLMFKRDQVDSMAVSTKGGDALDLDTESAADSKADTDALELQDTAASASGDTDRLDALGDEDSAGTDADGGTALDLELDEVGGGSATDLHLEEVGDLKDDTDALTVEEALGDVGQESHETAELNLSAESGLDLEAPAPGESSAQTIPFQPAAGKSDKNLDLEELSLEADEEPAPKRPGATGISVFDSQEMEAADSMARTQVSKAVKGEKEEDLALESVGSGSGLLDLTREGDDTSLGAVELLDEEDAKGEKSATGTIQGSVPGSATGVFDESGTAPADVSSLGTAEVAAAGEETGEGVEELEDGVELAPARYGAQVGEDPIGDAWGGATLLGVFAILATCAIIAYTGMNGQFLTLTQQFTTLASKTDPQEALYIMLGILLGVNLLLLGIGLFIGRMKAKRG